MATRPRWTVAGRASPGTAPESCSIAGCERPYRARGYCSTHYARVKRGLRLDLPVGRGSFDLSLPQRFWRNVDTTGGAFACWPWTGARDPKGYGATTLAPHRYLRAHRAAWMIAHGPIPDGLLVCHTCDNPPCCNPAHLWTGSNADNTADKVRKGRHRAAGQALIEFALILPLLALILLGGGEMAMLFAHYADQDRRTATLAEWAADHPAATAAEWNATVATVGPCANVAVSSPGPDLVAVGMTCVYTPMITRNIWDGLPVSTTATAAVTPTPTPTP